MRVFRPTWKRHPDSPSRRTANWHVEFRDHMDQVRKLAGFPDRGATEELGRKLERLVAFRAVGDPPPPELARWIERLPRRRREALVRLDLIDPVRQAASRSLAELVEEFRRSLEARGRTPKHIAHVAGRVLRLFEGCGFETWGDLDPALVESFLSREREEKGRSPKTLNHYLAAARELVLWALERGYADRDPLASLRRLRFNVQADRRLDRRALNVEQLRGVIAAADAGPTRCGLPGSERALLYELAAYTGLRVGELRALRVADLDLDDAEDPRLRVRASISKNGREAVLPVRQKTAGRLHAFVRKRLPAARIFPRFPGKPERALRFDLGRAGFPCQDEDGRPLDDKDGRTVGFHSLRISFSTMLDAAGTPKGLTEKLMRHQAVGLTYGTYTKHAREEERRAVEALPDLTANPAQVAQATGTDAGAEVSTDPTLAENLASESAGAGRSMPAGAEATRADDAESGDCVGVGGGGGGNRTRVPEPDDTERLRV